MSPVLFIISLLLAVMPVSAAPKEVFLLDFITQRGDDSIHGTLSLIDGAPKSTWTSQSGQNKKTSDTEMTEEQFRSIWDRISDLRELADFAVAQPDTKLSITDHFVVGIIYSFPAGQGKRTYLIPHDCKSEKILHWIRDIEAHSRSK